MRCDPDFASARNLLRQARNIESLKEAGNASFKTCDYATAIQKYNEAGAIDPSNESITLTLDSNRAQALLKSAQHAEAIVVCNKILKIDKQHFKALRTRARAKKANSEFDAAIADFEAAAKIAPTPKDKTEIMKEIKTTKVLIARSKYIDHC
jgi:DnaJ family protein C protein 7